MTQCPSPVDFSYSQHGLPCKLNSCAMSIRRFPLPEQDMWSQNACEPDAWSQQLNQGFPRQDEIPQALSDLAGACRLDHGQEYPAFNSSEDTDDDSAEVEAPQGEDDTDDDSAEVEAPQGEDGVGNALDYKGTTVMLCDIPCRVGRSNIVSALEALGFAGLYTFIHLPKGKSRRLRNHGSIGYSFINFRCLEDALDFAKVFEGFQFPGLQSIKKSTVKFAHLQGYNAKSILEKKKAAEGSGDGLRHNQ